MGQSAIVGSEEYEAPIPPVDFFTNARDFYTLLSSIYYVELTEEQIENLATVDFNYPDEESEIGRGFADIRRYLKRRGPHARQDLAVDYARIFLAAGTYEGETAVPFESVYTSDEGILMQDSRDDVVRIYATYGLEIPLDLHIPEDHLSFELEFMARLSGMLADLFENRESWTQEDAARAQKLMEAQLDFIDGHLLNWVPDLQKRVDNFAKHAFYPAILKITKGYIEENRALLAEFMEDKTLLAECMDDRVLLAECTDEKTE